MPLKWTGAFSRTARRITSDALREAESYIDVVKYGESWLNFSRWLTWLSNSNTRAFVLLS